MSRTSSIFKKLELQEPEEQQIEERKEVLPKIQRIRNPKDREENKIYETSVSDDNIFMGFNLERQREEFRKAQEDLQSRTVRRLIEMDKFQKHPIKEEI